MNNSTATMRQADDVLAGSTQTLGSLFTMAADTFDHDNALNYKRDEQWQRISSAQVVERSRNIALATLFTWYSKEVTVRRYLPRTRPSGLWRMLAASLPGSLMHRFTRPWLQRRSRIFSTTAERVSYSRKSRS